MFCYYAVLAVVALTTFTISTRNDEMSAGIIAKHFICERNGVVDPGRSCDRSHVEGLGNPAWTTMSYILLGIFPIVNLIYAVNVQELREYCTCGTLKRKLLKLSVSDNPSTSSTAANSSTMKK